MDGVNGRDGSDGTDGSNGTNGNNRLIEVTTERTDTTNCDGYGGEKISVGVDANGNGTLDEDEIDSVEYLCNVPQKKSLVNVTSEPTGTANCSGNGGHRVATGIDKNDNSVLDPDEETSVDYICNSSSTPDTYAGVELTLINNSADTTNSTFAVYGRNAAPAPSPGLSSRATSRATVTPSSFRTVKPSLRPTARAISRPNSKRPMATPTR